MESGIDVKVDVAKVLEVLVSYQCYLEDSESLIVANGWGNGEGFSLDIARPNVDGVKLDLTWADWKAIRRAVDEIEGFGV